jgi:hypothetical protein
MLIATSFESTKRGARGSGLITRKMHHPQARDTTPFVAAAPKGQELCAVFTQFPAPVGFWHDFTNELKEQFDGKKKKARTSHSVFVPTGR